MHVHNMQESLLLLMKYAALSLWRPCWLVIASPRKLCFASFMNAKVTSAPEANCDDVIKLFKANKTIEFMFVAINMFWARLRLILARAVRRGLKWALRRAQNIFMPKNINSISIIITLEGIERTNTEKMTTKRSEEYFFHQQCKETSANFEMASRFWLAAYIVWSFDSQFSLVHFSGLKYILARQILHFSP